MGVQKHPGVFIGRKHRCQPETLTNIATQQQQQHQRKKKKAVGNISMFTNLTDVPTRLIETNPSEISRVHIKHNQVTFRTNRKSRPS